MPFSECHRYQIALSVIVFVSCITWSWSIQGTSAQDEPYRILVTNDDGIRAPGIRALAEELGKASEVIVVAPSENRSGSSMSIVSNDILRVEKHEIEGEFFGYGVNGTPANAVFFGVLEVAKGKHINLVVSGINHGQNVGDVGHLSGTVGAAMTATFLGIPSVAVSLDSSENDYKFAAQYTTRFVTQLKKRGAPKGVVLSINIPAATRDEIKGVVPARMGGSYIQFKGFEERRDMRGGPYYWPMIGISTEFEAGTDSHAYQNKMITITPLKFDWTDYEMLNELKDWNLTTN